MASGNCVFALRAGSRSDSSPIGSFPDIRFPNTFNVGRFVATDNYGVPYSAQYAELISVPLSCNNAKRGLLKMLNEIHEKLERFCYNIDLIGEDRARNLTQEVLETIRESLEALIVEFRYRDVKQIPNKGDRDFLLRLAISADDEAKKHNDAGIKDLNNPNATNDYDPETDKGVWNWVYKFGYPMWIEDFDKEIELCNGEYGMPNAAEPEVLKIRGKPIVKEEEVDSDPAKVLKKLKDNREKEVENYRKCIPHAYLGKFELTQSIIIIPFPQNEALSDRVWGFLDIEFRTPKAYNKELYASLEGITKSLSVVLSKYAAWVRAKDGTAAAVTEFGKECKTLREGARSVRTGIYAGVNRGPTLDKVWIGTLADLDNRIRNAFEASRIDKNDYNSTKNRTRLNNGKVKLGAKQAHFGVFDLSSCDSNIVLLLGQMCWNDKPCLVLCRDSGDEGKQVGSMCAEAFGKKNTLWFFTYAEKGDGEEIGFKYGRKDKESPLNDAEKGRGIWTWKQVWDFFLKRVEAESMAYRQARPYDGQSE